MSLPREGKVVLSQLSLPLLKPEKTLAQQGEFFVSFTVGFEAVVVPVSDLLMFSYLIVQSNVSCLDSLSTMVFSVLATC